MTMIPEGKIAILGGGGFLGAHLARQLVGQGRDVTLVDVLFPTYRDPLYQGAKLVHGDLRVDSGWHFLDTADYSVIFQFAADMGGVEYFHGPNDWKAAVNNQLINSKAMQWIARRAPQARVVFSSTACALDTTYQTHQEWHSGRARFNLREKQLYKGKPDQLYGQEKRNSALMWMGSGLDVRVFFLHSTYGPYQEWFGVRSKFPIAMCRKAIEARRTGLVHMIGDGRQRRTYLYVDKAIARILAVTGSISHVGPFNIGSSASIKCDSFTRLALHLAGAGNADIVNIPGPTGVEVRGCDNTKFFKAFPWLKETVPQALSNGIRATITWLDTQLQSA